MKCLIVALCNNILKMNPWESITVTKLPVDIGAGCAYLDQNHVE